GQRRPRPAPPRRRHLGGSLGRRTGSSTLAILRALRVERQLMKSLLAGTLLLSATLVGAGGMPTPLPSVRGQDRIRQEWLKARLERVLPGLMRKHGVSMWIVVCREYNEDPVFISLVSPSVMAARRRTILVFNDLGPEHGVERLALGGGGSGGLYQVF